MNIIRQGDVLLIRTDSLPKDCVEVPLENGRIVLMHGEVTGHAHAIADFRVDQVSGMKVAGDMAARLINAAASRTKARLLRAPDGSRFLEVTAPVNLTHEEHTSHEILPGIYEIPVQVEHTSEHVIRQVAD